MMARRPSEYGKASDAQAARPWPAGCREGERIAVHRPPPRGPTGPKVVDGKDQRSWTARRRGAGTVARTAARLRCAAVPHASRTGVRRGLVVVGRSGDLARGACQDDMSCHLGYLFPICEGAPLWGDMGRRGTF